MLPALAYHHHHDAGGWLADTFARAFIYGGVNHLMRGLPPLAIVLVLALVIAAYLMFRRG